MSGRRWAERRMAGLVVAAGLTLLGGASAAVADPHDGWKEGHELVAKAEREWRKQRAEVSRERQKHSKEWRKHRAERQRERSKDFRERRKRREELRRERRKNSWRDPDGPRIRRSRD